MNAEQVTRAFWGTVGSYFDNGTEEALAFYRSIPNGPERALLNEMVIREQDVNKAVAEYQKAHADAVEYDTDARTAYLLTSKGHDIEAMYQEVQRLNAQH